jgi:rod shape-determining protein MreC
MRNLLNFLAKYNNLILFILFEGIALYLVVNGNNYHNSRVIKGVRGITSVLEEKISNTRNYLKLHEINSDLARENVALKNSIEHLIKKENLTIFSVSDTINWQQYVYTEGEVVNNSVNKQKNYFTLNKGKKQGVNTDMAVVSPDGVAGIIVGSSDNYSIAMSLLNIDFRLSSRMKSNGYFGSLAWDGRDYRYAILNEIPQHVTINAGDTVETTSFSSIFPEGIMVGTVSDFEKPGGDFYKIRVLLSTDFKKLNFVSIIGNLKKTEQQSLEKLNQ